MTETYGFRQDRYEYDLFYTRRDYVIIFSGMT